MNRRRRIEAYRLPCGVPAAGCIAAVLVGVAAISAPRAWSGSSEALAQSTEPMSIMMMVACVEAGDEGAFHLIRATEPEAIDDRLPPQPEPSAALGGNRIRLIGTLDEFGVGRHVGHKVWVRGLLVEDESERRLNLVSITHLSAGCE